MFTATAGQTDFPVSFPYLNRLHVSVRVNGRPVLYVWHTDSVVRALAPLSGGESVVIARDTPIDAQLVEFQNGAVLTQEDLNLAVKQVLYKQQELADLYERTLLEAQVRIGDANGVVTNPQEVADQLAQLVLEADILDEFRQRIADIDSQAEGLADVDGRLGQLRTDHEALAAVVDALGEIEDGSGLATVIAEERDQRIAGDTALAATISLLGAKNGASNAFILNLDTVKASPTQSLAERFTAIEANAASNASALVTTEATARASADASFASTLSLLGAKNGPGTAFILDTSTVQVGGGQTLGSRLSGIDTAIGAASASVVAEQSARITADGALASEISRVETRVDGNVASISAVASSVGGIAAKYGVSLDVNGYVTGFLQNNNGSSGSFVILADRFAVVAPGASPTVPFEVSGGSVFVNGTRLTPGSVGADRLNINSLSAITANIGFLVSYNPSGGRVERDGNGDRVYDSSNRLRVKLGF